MSINNNDIAIFIKYLQIEKQYSIQTIKAYKSDIKQFLVVLDDKNIRNVNENDVRLYLANKYKKLNSTKTILRKISSLKSFYTFLVNNNLIQTNPFENITVKKAGKHLPKYFYEKELKQMFDYVDSQQNILDIRNKLILETLYGVGLRISELINLKMKDIDIENNIITLLGKGNKIRKVPYGRYLKKIYLVYIKDIRNKLINKNYEDKGFVFLQSGKREHA